MKQHQSVSTPVAIDDAEAALAFLQPRVLPRLGAWSLRTITALQDAERLAPGYRDLIVAADGSRKWLYPRANAAERIAAWLWLGAELRDPAMLTAARHFGEAMTNDPARGIYQGPEEDGLGSVWYWRDSGLYMTNYTMRVPDGFLPLAAHSGETIYRNMAILAGDQLRRSQHPATGIPREGWLPRHPKPGAAPPTGECLANWLSPVKINSRVGYATLAFAKLYHATGDAAYASALERLAAGLSRYQNPDGSFPQDLRIDRFAPFSPVVKGHFLYYILNGTAQAACLCPEVPELATISTRLGLLLAGWFRHTGALPYGQPHGEPPQEADAWRSATPDAIAGFAWLAKLTGDPSYRHLACRLAVQTLLTTIDAPDDPDVHGAIPITSATADSGWTAGGHFHFWTILGLEALQVTRCASAGQPQHGQHPACAGTA